MFKIAIFVSLSLAISLFAASIALAVDNIEDGKEKFKYLKNVDYNLSRISNVSVGQTLNTDLLNDIWRRESLKKQDVDYEHLIKKEKETMTLFYFTSMSMTPLSWNSFFISVGKLNDIQGFAVLRGYEKDTKQSIMNDLNQTLVSERIPVRFKVHPFMYQELNITKIPSYVLAKCKGERFAFRKCKYLYRADGDITTKRFFELIGGRDDSYQSYYNKLIGM